MKQSYFNDNRYYNADVTEVNIKLEVDKSSPIYSDYEHTSMDKLEAIKLLEELVESDPIVLELVNDLPDNSSYKKSSIEIETMNKLYSFTRLHLLQHYSIVEIFDIFTSYLNIDSSDCYSKLAIKFREELLDSLKESGHYKSKALF